MDSKAFRNMMLAEFDALHRMAFHLARNADDAADLVQETFVKALAAEHQFELRERGIRPWLFKILHNVFFTKVGKRKHQAQQMASPEEELAAPAAEDGGPAWDLASLDWEQVDQRLKHAIDALPETYRVVILYWAVEGLKYREIADVLDVPLGTVMSRLYRARAMLSAQLTDLAIEQGIIAKSRE